MATCFDNLVGLRSLCTTDAPQPLYYLDDVEGMDATRLADLAALEDGSGKTLAARLIDSSIRILLGDIESLLSPGYQIKANQLANVCSSCNWSGFYANASSLGSGCVVKDNSYSRFSSLRIESLRVKLNSTGNFSFKIDDGLGQVKTISYAFVAGQEVTFQNVNYTTKAKSMKIFFENPLAQLAQVLCPANSSCGCGGAPKAVPTDLQIKGLHVGAETDTQYGILVCAVIGCSYDEILCSLVNSSPRLFGLALLQLVASKAFATNAVSQRVNRTAGYDQEEKKADSEIFYGYYRERLQGSPRKNILGIAQAISNNLALIKDACVTCHSSVGIAWAAG